MMAKRRMAGDEEVLLLLKRDRSGGLDASIGDEDLGLSDEDLYRGQWGTVSAIERKELQEHLEGRAYPYVPLYPAAIEQQELAYEDWVKTRLAALMLKYPNEAPNRLLALAL